MLVEDPAAVDHVDPANEARGRRMPSGTATVSAGRASAAIKSLLGESREQTVARWLGAVGRLVVDLRPDLGPTLAAHLGVEPSVGVSPLVEMSIGEIGVVYEALIALSDHKGRKVQGQFFTPDDVAIFMAKQASDFPVGHWLDPCCGVGNLAWHLANISEDPADFVENRISLVDIDEIALKTAVVLLVANFAGPNRRIAVNRLASRAVSADFLNTELPPHDYVIANPPYAAAQAPIGFRTARSRDLYAFFLERISEETSGFVVITPASHLGASKHAELRRLLKDLDGGSVYVFDNVPDTCFRGFKYGSTNTSTTNFVRAAITVRAPITSGWRVTPILRWAARSRAAMWRDAHRFLKPLREGPESVWAKVMPNTEAVWEMMAASPKTLQSLTTKKRTRYSLDVASTPRYYISASVRSLQRGSKHVLYFATQGDLDQAYILLNSSLPYWWWRCLDGGITLSLRTLLCLPLPPTLTADQSIIQRLRTSEQQDVVVKLNAGKNNENVKRPRQLVEAIDSMLLAGLTYSFADVYSPNMFSAVGETETVN